MRKNKLFILLFILILPAMVQAQSAGRVERSADAAFVKKDFFTAAKLYAAILYDSPLVVTPGKSIYPFQPRSGKHTAQVKSARRNEVMYKLAESYRLYNRPADAAVQYEKLLATQDTHFPQAKLWYAYSLLETDNPEKATTVFNEYLRQHRTKDEWSDKARAGLASAQFVIAAHAVKPTATVTKLQAAASGDGSNFGLDKLNDSVIIFTSSRHETDTKGEKIFPVSLYTASVNGRTASKLANFANDLDIATPSFSSDRLTMYFTGRRINLKSIAPYHIYYTSRARIDSPWRRPVELAAPVNVTGYQSKQPFITPDGAYLFFTSDQPGGKGKFDIWMVAMNGNEPMGRAFNLDSVNTEGDEVTPFYDAASAKLYFSSNGRPGMGGLDIYQTSGTPGHNTWSGVTNMGYPFNSARDDEYYRKDDRTGMAFLSSDRASSCCLEIFKAVDLPKVDSAKRAATDNVVAVTPPVIPQDTVKKSQLDSISAITLERNYIHYDFGSSRIRIIDRPVLNRMVRQLKNDPALNILVASFTDCIGSLQANVRVAQKRSESVKAYLLAHGIDAARVNIEFFGKQHFVLPCAQGKQFNREEQIANRRSDLILTKEKNPQWQPAGNELDVDRSQYSPLHKMVQNNTQSGGNNPAVDAGMSNSKESTVPDVVRKQKDDNSAAPNRQLAMSNNNNPSSTNIDRNTNISTAKTGGGVAAVNGSNKKSAAALKDISTPLPDKNNTNSAHSKYKKGANNKLTKTAAPALSKPKPETVRAKTAADDAVETEKFASTKRMEKLSINKMLDFTPHVNTGIIAEMTKRVPRKPLVLYSTSDSVRIDLYDNGVFDNDSVSVIYNKQLVSYKQLLQTNKPISFYVKLHADPMQNEMILFAENLGITPPNSALMIITDGDKKRTEVNVTSDLEHNTVIYFIKVNREKQ